MDGAMESACCRIQQVGNMNTGEEKSPRQPEAKGRIAPSRRRGRESRKPGRFQGPSSRAQAIIMTGAGVAQAHAEPRGISMDGCGEIGLPGRAAFVDCCFDNGVDDEQLACDAIDIVKRRRDRVTSLPDILRLVLFENDTRTSDRDDASSARVEPGQRLRLAGEEGSNTAQRR